jgi:uncharacterized membrane protein YoaK (UPF0700 family)
LAAVFAALIITDMPIDYARKLVGRKRTAGANRQLGFALAFIAGAINAGGYLAVRQYTSHMTGMVSIMADQIVLGSFDLVLNALGGLISFLFGAGITAMLVNFAKRRHVHSEYAIPLLLEAGLLLLFGLLGVRLQAISGLFVPVTVMLLCFMMGLQNALITKISRTEIRTTHVTGILTDIGIELGKLLYWNRNSSDSQMKVQANRERLTVLCTLTGLFFVGGLAGATGFKYIGYASTVPLALLLIALASVPAADDLSVYWRRKRKVR